MKQTALTIALLSAPALLAAQQAAANASASVSTQAEVSIPSSYSADARAKIEAAFKAAHAKQVPDDQMRKRLAEGQAKNASDAQVAAAIEHVETRLEASQSLFVRAGRANPQPDEVTNGEQAMERGATEAQILAAIKNPPANVTVAAALNALGRVGQTEAAATGTAGAAAKGAGGAVNAGATAGAAVNGAVGGVGAGVTGAVGGVLAPKKP